MSFNTSFILQFLSELQQDNSKGWMDANRERYHEAKNEFKKLVGYVLEGIRPHDESLAGTTVQESIFRITRNTQFSKDKTPYKPWMAASLAEGGRHAVGAHYYFHLQPNNETIVAGGIYHPAPDILRKIRQEIDYNAHELKEIVGAKEFQKNFGVIQGEMLKKAPKGYPVEHPNIELLKLKDFLAIQKFTDQEVQDDSFADKLVASFLTVRPFNEYLNVAIS